MIRSLFPFIRRNLAEPLHVFANRSPRRKYWRELEESQDLSGKDLSERQWRRLSCLLQYVYENNSFYRRRLRNVGLHPSGVKSPSDMGLLPILTKEEIRSNAAEMISVGFSRERLLNFKTGGSTGKPLDIYITEECSEIRNACARRHDRWSGWEVGEPIGAVWGNPILPEDLKSKLRNWLLTPTIYLDTMQVSEGAVWNFAKQWERVRPTLLFGHAHSIYLLALYARDMGIKSICPKGIITSSMMLMPHERQTIESVFGKIVFDRYGCEEVSLIASECEKHEGMHLNIEHLFIEFLKEDGRPAEPGEPGKIIVTDLINRAMPFIRYQVEDFGVPLNRKCSCRRGLPLMEKVVGRTADFLVRGDGARIAGVSLIENTLTKFGGIEQMQIVQEDVHHIVLNLVAGRSYDSHSETALRDYFSGLFDNEVRIEINLLDRIDPETSGKYRFSICKVTA